MKNLFLISIMAFVSSSFAGGTKTQTAVTDPMPGLFRTQMEELVNINSGTNNPEGNQQIREILIRYFESLGFSSRVIEVPKLGDDTKKHHILVFEMANSKPDILVLGHTDTVFEKFHPFQKMEDKGDIITGPGVVDMKGSILLFYNALMNIPDKSKLAKFRIAFNDDEEIGSTSTRGVLKEFADQSKYVLIIESPQQADVSTSHSGIIQKEVTVYGVEAHAGAAPLTGVNACLENAMKTIKVYELNNYDSGLTFNSGIVRTYDAAKANTLCGEIKNIWDIRYINPSEFAGGQSRFEKIMKTHYAPNPSNKEIKETKIVDLNFTPALPIEKCQKLLDLFKSIAKEKLGVEVVSKHKGGVDAYGISDSNVEILTGLGLQGDGMHSDKEFTNANLFGRKINLLIVFLSQLSSNSSPE